MTDIASATRRYLALHFPFLPAERLCAERTKARAGSPDAAAPLPSPLVLVTKVRGALRVAAADRAGHALGLAPGLALADARARHPDLATLPFDPAADAACLARLAQGCQRFTPLVALVPPAGITLDIAGAAHLFDGEAGLAAALIGGLDQDGFTVGHAFADSAEGAQALARFVGTPAHDEAAALRGLPVSALGLEAEATLALQRAGLTTLGALAARPGAALAARFGIAAVTALERVLGQRRDAMPALPHHRALRFERRFAEPVARQDSLAAAFAALLRQGMAELAERGLGGRRFVLALARSDGARRHLTIDTGAPTRDPALVLRLFDERIAALADPLDPGFGFDALTLAIPRTEPLAAAQADFTGEAAVRTALNELVDRLSTRLGPDSIRRLAPVDSHLPEQAQLALPAIEAGAPQPWPQPPPGEPPLRPLFLFDPPQPVEVIAEVPDGPPHRFRWKRHLREVRRFEGPERIAAEWWQRPGGEHGPGAGETEAGLTRDYYRVEDARGRRYWIFRHGLYAEKPRPKWYVHGLFA